jgi:quercetin dioxygenase-like cupin family protein
MVRQRLAIAVVFLTLAAVPAAAQDYDPAGAGTRILEGRGGFSIKMLVEQSNLGGSEVEIGEITFPVGTEGGSGHVHGSVEIFYILTGEFDHIVNGAHHVLRPGMVGIVRPGDEVVHRVLSDEPVRALVIWAPGGEAAGLERFLTERPIE